MRLTAASQQHRNAVTASRSTVALSESADE